MTSDYSKMSINLIIVLCFGVLAIQGKPRYDTKFTGAFDNVIDMLKKLEEQVKEASQSAIDTVSKDFENMSGAIASMSELSATLNYISQDFVDSTGSLQKESIRRGINISECTDEILATVKQRPDEILSNVSKCYNPKYEKAQNFMEEIKNEINGTLGGVNKYWDEITECQNESSQEQQTCISQISDEITKDSQTIPMKIESLLETVTDYLTALKTDLFYCYDEEIIQYKKDTSEWMKSIWDCTMDKWVHPPTTPSTTSINME